MQKIGPVITFKVWYKPNPEYDGNFQMDKIGEGGLHATVTPQMGGQAKAQQMAGDVKRWFNEEKVAVERSDAKGKKYVDVKTTFHNNVIVWIEKFKDGYSVQEEVPCPDVPMPSPKPQDEMTNAQLLARLQELERRLAEKEENKPEEDNKPSKKVKKVKEDEEELVGIR